MEKNNLEHKINIQNEEKKRDPWPIIILMVIGLLVGAFITVFGFFDNELAVPILLIVPLLGGILGFFIKVNKKNIKEEVPYKSWSKQFKKVYYYSLLACSFVAVTIYIYVDKDYFFQPYYPYPISHLVRNIFVWIMDAVFLISAFFSNRHHFKSV